MAKRERLKLGVRNLEDACLPFEKPIVELEKTIEQLKSHSKNGIDLNGEIKSAEKKLAKALSETFENLTAWQRVQVARHPLRPYTLDYLERITDDFVELHGDRAFGDDRAIVTGFARSGDRKYCFVGHQKGRDTKENLFRCFGSAHPEGYRKAIRVMKLAEKFALPVVSFIDTPGAYPGIGAEERGQAEAIAFNLREMAALETPVLAVVIGEGGSGGALGIGVADRVVILENAYYSVISPEGCAAILWKDQSQVAQAAEALKLTSYDLLRLGIVDKVLKEPLGGAHRDVDKMAGDLKEVLERYLKELAALPKKELIERRYQKFRHFGSFAEKE